MITQVEYGGSTGLLRYCGLVSSGLADQPNQVLTARNFDQSCLPEGTSVDARLKWSGRGGARSAADVLISERAIRRRLNELSQSGPIFIQSGMFTPPRHRSVVHVIHDPRARPIAGMHAMGAAVRWLRERGPSWTAYHAPGFDFDSTGQVLRFPHPTGPGAFIRRPGYLHDVFPIANDRQALRVFAFGRAAHPDAIRRLATRLGELKGANIELLAWGGRLTSSDQVQSGIRVITRPGRVPNEILDALVMDSDAIAVPHEGFPNSASSILSVAVHHKKAALVSDEVRTDIVDGGTDVAVRLSSYEELDAWLEHPHLKVGGLTKQIWGSLFTGLLLNAGLI